MFTIDYQMLLVIVFVVISILILRFLYKRVTKQSYYEPSLEDSIEFFNASIEGLDVDLTQEDDLSKLRRGRAFQTTPEGYLRLEGQSEWSPGTNIWTRKIDIPSTFGRNLKIIANWKEEKGTLIDLDTDHLFRWISYETGKEYHVKGLDPTNDQDKDWNAKEWNIERESDTDSLIVYIGDRLDKFNSGAIIFGNIHISGINTEFSPLHHQDKILNGYYLKTGKWLRSINSEQPDLLPIKQFGLLPDQVQVWSFLLDQKFVPPVNLVPVATWFVQSHQSVIEGYSGIYHRLSMNRTLIVLETFGSGKGPIYIWSWNPRIDGRRYLLTLRWNHTQPMAFLNGTELKEAFQIFFKTKWSDTAELVRDLKTDPKRGILDMIDIFENIKNNPDNKLRGCSIYGTGNLSTHKIKIGFWCDSIAKQPSPQKGGFLQELIFNSFDLDSKFEQPQPIIELSQFGNNDHIVINSHIFDLIMSHPVKDIELDELAQYLLSHNDIISKDPNVDMDADVVETFVSNIKTFEVNHHIQMTCTEDDDRCEVGKLSPFYTLLRMIQEEGQSILQVESVKQFIKEKITKEMMEQVLDEFRQSTGDEQILKEKLVIIQLLSSHLSEPSSSQSQSPDDSISNTYTSSSFKDIESKTSTEDPEPKTIRQDDIEFVDKPLAPIEDELQFSKVWAERLGPII